MLDPGQPLGSRLHPTCFWMSARDLSLSQQLPDTLWTHHLHDRVHLTLLLQLSDLPRDRRAVTGGWVGGGGP